MVQIDCYFMIKFVNIVVNFLYDFIFWRSSILFPIVLEQFEEAEGRSPGEISIADLPAVLKLKKELCEANVRNFKLVFVCIIGCLVIKLQSCCTVLSLFQCRHSMHPM